MQNIESAPNTSALADLLAQVINDELKEASDGHCTRINHLDLPLCQDVIPALMSIKNGRKTKLIAKILWTSSSGSEGATVRADQAIEIRNRKEGVFCLLVPAGTDNSTASSLGNSFAEINGSDLMQRALTNFLKQPAHRNTSTAVAAIRNAFTGIGVHSRPTASDILGFALAAAEREKNGDPNSIGEELWRVGLVPDRRDDFARNLRRNRQFVSAIARPRRMTSSLRERMAQTKLAPESSAQFESHLRYRRLDDVKSWSRSLAEANLTFDQFVFPESAEPSDCIEVQLKPFLDERGALVLANAKGLTQDAPGTPLFAVVGEKKTLKVGWVTVPPKTTVEQWRVDIVPANEHEQVHDEFSELPGIHVKKGTARTATLKLNLNSLGNEDVPEYAVQVRVRAIGELGEELQDKDEVVLEAFSPPFYLTTDEDAVGPNPGAGRERQEGARSLAEGLLRVVTNRKVNAEKLISPQWHPGTPLTRFTMRAGDRESVTVSLNSDLLELQRRTVAQPECLGIWSLKLAELRPATLDDYSPFLDELTTVQSESGRAYLRSRRQLFGKLAGSDEESARNTIETADWDDESLRKAVTDHAIKWSDWVAGATGVELQLARSVDTILVEVGEDGQLVDAIVAMPTHPLRALWIASYSALLANWTSKLVEIETRQRTFQMDLGLLEIVTPANYPPLLHHPDRDTPLTFYRNLDLGNAVAVRSDRSDEAAQFEFIRDIFGYPGSPGRFEDTLRGRASVTLKRFWDSHPYADPFRISLIHPDDGSFLESSVSGWRALLEKEHAAQFDAPNTESDELEPLEMPSIEITNYVNDFANGQMLTEIDIQKYHRSDVVSRNLSDHLRPSVSLYTRPVESLTATPTSATRHQHHVAIIQELSGPVPSALVASPDTSDKPGLALHGLVARFTRHIERSNDSTDIRYWIDTTAAVEPHPVDKKLSEALVRGLRSANQASARLIDPGTPPSDALDSGLHVKLTSADTSLIERIHEHTDWVITIDRFIGADLFDQPDNISRRTYILDASPSFQDGITRQSFVTTSSRSEAELILERAMGGLGLTQLKDSIGSLLGLLRRVSGRLVLDALQTDTRAREVVGIGSVIAWLDSQGALRDSVIVPIDSHLELFTDPGRLVDDAANRADLALFRFKSDKKLEVAIVEVKSRSKISGELDTLLDLIDDQLRASARALNSRTDPDRIDAVLQRSRIAQVLRFYLDRSLRYKQIGDTEYEKFAQRINGFERGRASLEISQLGFVIALDPDEEPRERAVGDSTHVRILTIPEISRAAQAAAGLAEFTDEAESIAEDAVERHDVETNPALEFDSEELSTEAPEVSEHKDTAAGVTHQDVLLGHAGNQPIVWKPRVTGSPHLFILGIPGQGKSVTIERILTELAKSQTPSFILDFHGTFSNPENELVRRTGMVQLDAAKGLPFSPFHLDPHSSQLQVNLHAREIANVVDHVFGLGEIQQDVFYSTLVDLYRRHGYGLEQPSDATLVPVTIDDVKKALERNQQRGGVKNVIARTRPLFDFDLFKAGYERDSFDELLSSGVVIGLNKLGGDELPLALSAFLLRRLYLSFPKMAVADRIRLVIVLDEAHRLAKDITLPKIMKEARKYGIGVVIASQGLADFNPDVVGNAGTKISFRINHPDSRKVAGFFNAGPGQDLVSALERLSVGESLIQTPEMLRAGKVTMLQPDPVI